MEKLAELITWKVKYFQAIFFVTSLTHENNELCELCSQYNNRKYCWSDKNSECFLKNASLNNVSFARTITILYLLVQK